MTWISNCHVWVRERKIGLSLGDASAESFEIIHLEILPVKLPRLHQVEEEEEEEDMEFDLFG